MKRKTKIIISVIFGSLGISIIISGIVFLSISLTGVYKAYFEPGVNLFGLGKPILDKVVKNKQQIITNCYNSKTNTSVEQINNNLNLYNIELDATYIKYLVNDTLYLNFNDLSCASLTQDTIINFNKPSKVLNDNDLAFFEQVKSINITLFQKQSSTQNWTYVLNFNDLCFNNFSYLTKISISNQSQNYFYNNNWVKHVSKNSFPTSLEEFYTDASFYPFYYHNKTFYNYKGLFRNLINLKKFVYNGQIYANTDWINESNNVLSPYMYSNQYYIPMSCFANCPSDFRLYSTATYGFKNIQERNEFLNIYSNIKPIKIPMYFDYRTSLLTDDWSFPSTFLDQDNTYNLDIYNIYRLDYYQAVDPNIIPKEFEGKKFSGYCINQILYNEIYKKMN